MEGRIRLLLFDNREHVLDAAADLIEAILAASATVRILATSREGFAVLDEQQFLRSGVMCCTDGLVCATATS